MHIFLFIIFYYPIEKKYIYKIHNKTNTVSDKKTIYKLTSI